MKNLGILVLLCLPARVHALEPLLRISTGILTAVETMTKASSATPNNVGPTSPNRVLPGEPRKRKNYFIPALEIPVFQFALNRYDRAVYGPDDYGITFNNGWQHVLHGPWVVDQDDFMINQLGHPYQGSMYYGFARASGLNFWEGWIYSNMGSLIWETYGETTRPSINDQVASGTGGPLIGEPLFRMANLVLGGGDGPPGPWRELGAAFISPPTALNRLLFGERYTPILKSRNAATFTQVQAGVGVNATVRNPGSADSIGRNVAAGDFAIAYGLPGQPGYLYLRPFDYFTFEIYGLRENRDDFSNIMTRGLLFGEKYELGETYQGVWGLYGSYDYFSPQVFRFSTTAASFGSTFQWWLSRKVAIQGTLSGGIGYGAAGTIVPQGNEKDFHYGAAPQGLLAMRLIFGKLAMLDTSLRGYYLSGTGASRAQGDETIGRANASFFVRIYGHHALGIVYMRTSREAHYLGAASLPAKHQRVETIGIAYNLIGDVHFGAVNWDRN